MNIYYNDINPWEKAGLTAINNIYSGGEGI